MSKSSNYYRYKLAHEQPRQAYVMWSSKMNLKSKNMIFEFFLHFLLGHCLGFNLVKTPQRLGNCFWRYKQVKDWTNNKKQKKLSALFCCILKTVFVSSNSFCLITSHMHAVTYISIHFFYVFQLILKITIFNFISVKVWTLCHKCEIPCRKN